MKKLTIETISLGLLISLPIIFIIGLVVFTIYPFLPIATGSVTGELVSVEVHTWGDFCGDYPWTRVELTNYSVDGDMSSYDNKFRFNDEYWYVEDLTIGETYKFIFKKGSRPSDTTSGDSITQYYLLGVETIE